MYKIFILVFLSLFLSCENINTSSEKNQDFNKQVESFLNTQDSSYNEFEIKPIQDFNSKYFRNEINKNLAKKLKVNQAIYKTDFDNNGNEDLLVIGDPKWCIGENNESCSFNALVILNHNHKDAKVISLSTNNTDYFVPKIEYLKGKPLIAIYKNEILDWEKQTISNKPLKKVLEYKFGDFIEYKDVKDNNYNIQKIEYKTSICFGTCPEFEIIIDTTKNATYKAINFNFSEEYSENNFEGLYKTKIRNEDYSKIIDLLNHIDFPYLKDEYNVSWTDDQTGTLKIYYNYGKYKEISDYGLQGTKGLEMLHKLLFNLRKEQNWKKIE